MQVVRLRLILLVFFMLLTQPYRSPNAATFRHKIFCFCLLLLILSLQIQAQSALNDTIRRKRIQLITGINVAGYATTLYLLNNAWYKNYPKAPFRVFNDLKEWNQMDKIGHAWTSYMLGAPSTQMWRWTGMREQTSIFLGGLSGFTFLTAIEFLDAHSAKWGWSWGDMAANAAGSALYIGQQLTWKEQRIQLKFSFHQMRYADAQLTQRANELFGSTWYERMLKDYNGQTYWLSVNIHAFRPQSKWPAWLNVAAGYGADGMLGGFENLAKDENGLITFDRRDVPRLRQFYLAPDIDWSRIKTQKKWLRTAFSILNVLKAPAPALEWNSNGKLRFSALYF